MTVTVMGGGELPRDGQLNGSIAAPGGADEVRVFARGQDRRRQSGVGDDAVSGNGVVRVPQGDDVVRGIGVRWDGEAQSVAGALKGEENSARIDAVTQVNGNR